MAATNLVGHLLGRPFLIRLLLSLDQSLDLRLNLFQQLLFYPLVVHLVIVIVIFRRRTPVLQVNVDGDRPIFLTTKSTSLPRMPFVGVAQGLHARCER